ncbi:MAG: hypothetical protein JO246_09365 [Frankiaceae bacterium]|nr:hypothetical protein [Frankiaceae bacterium]MBV9871454.1 hypothetical protein [Frankiaceae bacterium]
MATGDPEYDGARRPGLQLPIEITAITAILALALALMAGAGAALYQKSRPANYLSVAVLLIDQPLVVAQTPDAAPLQKLQLLRYQYIGLLKTETIAVPVARQVGNISVGQVENDLVGSADPLSFTITIAATADNPSESNLVAQAAVSQLTSYVDKSQQHLGVPVTSRVVLTELTPPHAGVRVSLSTTKILLPAVIAFIVVGGAFLIIADLLRRRN